MRVVSEAPGKIILAGEHFVVKNEPAIAAAIGLKAKVYVKEHDKPWIEIDAKNLGIRIRLSADLSRIEGQVNRMKQFIKVIECLKKLSELKPAYIVIDSEIPVAVGLGSSASTAVALTAAYAEYLGLKLSKEDISSIAYEAEKIVHKSPSGIDNTIATYGGVIAYRRGEGFLPLEVKGLEQCEIIVADTGIERSTGALVEKVLRLYDRYPEVFMPLYHAAGHLVIEMAHSLREGNIERVGELMNICQGMLYAIGVSNMAIERIVHKAREAGALGAKLTGAGGGGAVIVLCWKEDSEKIVQAIKELAKAIYRAEFDMKGVRTSLEY
ncbi:MAG: mevalonate kinase [Thermoprotei archaeon]|nr:MAG: mevalonate kinase [Thermoprotei archaeon]RLF24285.1 MAG: mevalonate kinase [Thermoprotei archaeon]